jgi:hypothetical protein
MRIFFSEEKKQKTFNSGARGKIEAMAPIFGAARKPKSFGSFLVTAQVVVVDQAA